MLTPFNLVNIVSNEEVESLRHKERMMGFVVLR
ncbi:hypothetical protein V6Z11_D03G206100 [Gossypium hirsutum]